MPTLLPNLTSLILNGETTGSSLSISLCLFLALPTSRLISLSVSLSNANLSLEVKGPLIFLLGARPSSNEY